MSRLLAALLASIFCLPWSASAIEPNILFLTWMKDPLTTTVVQWILPEAEPQDLLYYREESDPDLDSWRPVFAKRQPLPDRKHLLYVAELSGLKAGESYQFRLGKLGDLHRFRTLPANTHTPIRFIVGGDVFNLGHEELCSKMNVAAAARDPHFVVMGGDLAYATDKLGLFGDRPDHWYSWLRLWTKEMITSEGYMIPMVPVIGNHDVLGRYDQTNQQAPFFYALFPFPGIHGYNVLDFGDYMSIMVMDTGHTHPISGRQTAWVSETLKERKAVKHKFAVYHVPAFSSRESEFRTGKQGPIIRAEWVPLFDQYGLHAAFEHHEHVYKRTHPLKNGQIDADGTIYVGDGAWGVPPRSADRAEDVWYLAKTQSINHGILVTIDDHERRYQAVSSDGNIFDEAVQIHDRTSRAPLAHMLSK